MEMTKSPIIRQKFETENGRNAAGYPTLFSILKMQANPSISIDMKVYFYT